MESPFFRVFVGHYDKSNDTKNDISKLRNLGMHPGLYKDEKGYSVFVAATLKREDAENILSNLIKKGYDAYLKEPGK